MLPESGVFVGGRSGPLQECTAKAKDSVGDSHEYHSDRRRIKPLLQVYIGLAFAVITMFAGHEVTIFFIASSRLNLLTEKHGILAKTTEANQFCEKIVLHNWAISAVSRR
jgi:hypothetical protein